MQGRKRFKLYQQLLAFAFSLVQAAGQEFYLKQYVPEFSTQWFLVSLAILSGGSMVLVKVTPVAAADIAWTQRLPVLRAAFLRLGTRSRVGCQVMWTWHARCGCSQLQVTCELS